MQMQLSQKERMLLEDDKEQEELCVQKYQSFAKQASDPELQQLFNKLSQEEQHHYDMINQLLQGQQPNMNQGLGSSQMGSSQMSSSMSQSSSAIFGKQGSDNDKLLCTDLLSTEKYVSGAYNTGVFEAANPVIRQTLQHIQKEEQKHGEQLFNYMHSHGMYNVK
ncbi:MAG TPA: spore coat protein [Lachnospiraceae bacterium]|nr:spore coat protein [Lachnospiraceae bacterium]